MITPAKFRLRAQNLGGQNLGVNLGEILNSRRDIRRDSHRDIKILETKKARRESSFGNLAKIPKCQHADPYIINSLREIFSSGRNKHTEIRLHRVKNNQICIDREVTHSSALTVKYQTLSPSLAI